MPVEELKSRVENGQTAFKAPAPKLTAMPPRIVGFLLATIALLFCFCLPLYDLLRLAVSDDLYSDIPLIPLVSLYLVWVRRESLPLFLKPAFTPAVLFSAAGLLTIAIYWLTPSGDSETIANFLAFHIFALLLFFTGICFFFLGKVFLRAIAFPVALLVFTVPLPDVFRQGIETFLQYGSATVAGILFQISGMPVLQDGLNFQLAGCVIQVAPECSGIHSTLVLMITSLLGGWLFLRSPWKRAVLALAVIPLALIRNGFRIFIIGQLCAAYGPQMLASPIHRHGGPLFFILSLIPLFLLLLLLKKTERSSLGHATKKSL